MLTDSFQSVFNDNNIGSNNALKEAQGTLHVELGGGRWWGGGSKGESIGNCNACFSTHEQ